MDEHPGDGKCRIVATVPRDGGRHSFNVDQARFASWWVMSFQPTATNATKGLKLRRKC